MNLSQSTIGVLVDMIENKLAVMQMGDREELREIMALRRCLNELRLLSESMGKDAQETIKRGRRRKLSALIEEYAQTDARQA